MTSPIGTKGHLNRRSNLPSYEHTPSLQDKIGFTLIELVLVAFLISVLVGLSTPLFRRTFLGLELKNAAFNIAATINYCQGMAVVERTNYKVNFDFEKGRYWVTRLEECEGAQVYKRIGGKFGRTFYLPRGVNFIGKGTAIILYPDGRSDELELKIADRAGEGYILRVKGFGDKLDIQEIEGR